MYRQRVQSFGVKKKKVRFWYSVFVWVNKQKAPFVAELKLYVNNGNCALSIQVINFQVDEAVIPEVNKALLDRAAEIINKTLATMSIRTTKIDYT